MSIPLLHIAIMLVEGRSPSLRLANRYRNTLHTLREVDIAAPAL